MLSRPIIAGAAAIFMLTATAAITANAGEVLNREYRQQGRIAQGVGSGQLTGRETSNLERRETNINASRQRDLAANGGHLTGAERQNLNARENAVSGRIYTDKHNLRTQPGVTPQ